MEVLSLHPPRYSLRGDLIPFPALKAAVRTPVFIPQALLLAKGLFRDGLIVSLLLSLTDSSSLTPASCWWSSQPFPFTSHPDRRALWEQPELPPATLEEPQSPGRGVSRIPYHQGIVPQDLNRVDRPGCWCQGPLMVTNCWRQDNDSDIGLSWDSCQGEQQETGLETKLWQ